VLTDISGTRLHESVEAIAAAHPQCQVIQQRANGIDAKEAAEVAGVALERFGKVDILINVVGGIRSKQLYTPFLEMTEQQWDDTFALNLKPGFHLIRKLAPGMLERSYGKIVNISSVVLPANRGNAITQRPKRPSHPGRAVWPASSRPTSTSIALRQVSYAHP
jgi:Short-chain alcohol dehydrogenase of unknown specificity